METNIIKEYLSLLKQYKEQYGEKTALLMQVGSFYEIYALKNDAGEIVENTDIINITNICGLAIADKKQIYGGRAVAMAGFRDFIYDKYVKILTDAGYTCVIFNQEKKGSKFIRKLDSIISAGTHITYETDQSNKRTNHVMCIWLEAISGGAKKGLLIGSAAANTFTGKTFFFEYESAAENYLVSATFDDLERQVCIYEPAETIFVTNLTRAQITEIENMINLKCSTVHVVSLADNQKARNCSNQTYIEHVLKTYFKEKQPPRDEFLAHPIATAAYSYLLDFIWEHNPSLMKHIEAPDFITGSSRVLLGNHTLRQLNILCDGVGEGQFASVERFLNQTSTPMGARRFYQQLVYPIYDSDKLAAEYAAVDAARADVGLRRQLGGIRDLEKIARQLVMRRILPATIHHLVTSVEIIKEIAATAKSVPTVSAAAAAEKISAFLEQTFIIENLKGATSTTAFEKPIFRAGFSPPLDAAVRTFYGAEEEFRNIHKALNEMIGDEFVRIHETEKSGMSLIITQRRATILKSKLAAAATGHYAEIKFVAAGSASNYEVTSPHIKELINTMRDGREKLNELTAKIYLDTLTIMEMELYGDIIMLAEFVGRLDVLVCKAFVAEKYNYCRPQIAAEGDGGMIRARDLRHVLIEHLNRDEIYVPNNANLGGADAEIGALLYGVNTTGKTSYIRSVGIATIMAQAGMFVPAAEFVFRPYKSIFTRILSNDNLFQGLSTFATEMSELRLIIKMADNYSLVLGDELCSGTELQSALSIFTVGLMTLYERQSCFLFATHFHEILEYEEIRAMTRCAVKHMSVLYDYAKDKLVYRRKLEDGAGYKMYGIEVCKSLHMPADFIEAAYRLRNKYYIETQGALSHKVSAYSPAKIRGLCENCGAPAQETHHIVPQAAADARGFIGSFHKNHPANLKALCAACHDTEHATKK